MNWNAVEVASVDPLIASLDADSGSRNSDLRGAAIVLSPPACGPLTVGCPGPRSLLIRHLCREMGFSEDRLCQWRLEHKLVQALVVNHYCPGAVPVTRGAWRTLLSTDPAATRDSMAALCASSDLFIKKALDNGSGERKKADAREACLQALDALSPAIAPDAIHDEAFVLQERVAIDEEYRIHTVEDRVAPELTFRRYGWGIGSSERDGPNAFVQGLLDRLPNALVRGAVSAWDIARTSDGRFVVIEINLTGYHTVYEPGFHCSGFFLGSWAAPLAAKLIAYLERTYGVTVRIQADADRGNETVDAYWRVARWHELFRISDVIDALTASATEHGDGPDSAPKDKWIAEHRAFMTVLSRFENVSSTLKTLA